MKVTIDLCLIPIGTGISLSPYIAACEEIIKESGLLYRLHAYGTNIEGGWDEVFSVVKKCHDTVHKLGVPRISTTLQVGTRTDMRETITGKVASIKKLLHTSSIK